MSEVETEQPSWGFHVRFRNEAPLHLDVLATYIIGLQDLVWVAAASDVIPEVTREAAASPEYKTKILAKAVDHANKTASSAYARRVSYDSPLEVVFYIGAASGVVLPIGYQLLGLYDKFLDARAKKADTDLRVTALRLLEDRLRAAEGEHDFGVLTEMFPGAQSRVTQGSAALSAIESLDVIERPDQEQH